MFFFGAEPTYRQLSQPLSSFVKRDHMLLSTGHRAGLPIHAVSLAGPFYYFCFLSKCSSPPRISERSQRPSLLSSYWFDHVRIHLT